MLAWAVHRVAYLNPNVACRFITLDAKRHSDDEKDSYHFYKKYGFCVLKNKNKTEFEIAKQNSGTTSMYLDLYQIIKKVKNRLNF